MTRTSQGFPIRGGNIHFAYFYQVQQQNAEALSLYLQALTNGEQSLGPRHPKTNATRTAYTHLLRELGRVDESATVEMQAQTSLPL